MQAKPLFLSACVLASVAGAVGGAAIDTRPIQKAGIGSEMLPRAGIAFAAADSEPAQIALPDHYAMDTPEGRIEPAELANRGLYAQQRFGWHEASYVPPPEPAFADPEERPGPATDYGETAGNPAGPAAPAAAPVAPRTIDVGAELAAAG